MVGTDGALALPWLDAVLRSTLQQRAHALLLHGPQGVGQFELALTIAQAWLCEAADEARHPCGVCASCRLVQAHSHPDLLVLLPEALRPALGWSSDDDTEATPAAGKAKPSKEIKVDAVRAAVYFAQTTSSRGRCKVVVLHPAERMNAIAANALLKTLEEPPGAARFVLTCNTPDALPPTIRSRCQQVALALPPAEQAITWLAEQGVAEPAVLLAAAGGQPQQALEWAQQGVDAALWTRLPALVARGDGAAALSGWPLPRVIDALQKLCHDAACIAVGAPPRYFAAADLPRLPDTTLLSAWMTELMRVAAHAEHPWSAPLLIEALVQQGRHALAGDAARKRDDAAPKRAAGQGVSVHSGG